MNFTRHIALLTIVAGMMQPALAMKKKVEPEEAFFRALTKPSNLRLAGNLFENEEILKPALAYAHKLFKSRVIELAQAETRPWIQKITKKNWWGREELVKVKNTHVCLLRLFKAAIVLEQLEWVKEGISRKREFVNQDFRMGYGNNSAYGYASYEEDRSHAMEKWRDDVMRLDRQRNEERERRAQEWARQQAQIKPVQLVAQAPVRQEKPRYTFQDARQAVARGDVALLLEILDANVLSSASVQDLLGAACDLGNNEIVQLLFAKMEQFNAPEQTKPSQTAKFKFGGNSNIDEL